MELSTLKLDQVRDGHGGEGVVSRVVAPATLKGYCVKQLSSATTVTWTKLQYQIENPPSALETGKFLLAWPLQLVTSRGKPCGFLMRSAHEPHVKLLDLTRQRIDIDKEAGFRKFDRENRTGFINRAKMCINICAALESLYSVGEYNILDLRPDNILVTAKGDVTLVDLDSIQIRKGGRIIHAGSNGTPGYRPPECGLGVPEDYYKDASWDNFALGVILYQVLIGAHPFSGTFFSPYDKSLDIGSKVADSLFVHGENAQLIKVRPPIHDTFLILPQSIQSLFRRALGRDRAQRPNPAEWGPALATLVGQLDKGIVTVPPIAKPKPMSRPTVSPLIGLVGSIGASHARPAIGQPASRSASATSPQPPPPKPFPILAIVGWGVGLLILLNVVSCVSGFFRDISRPVPQPQPVNSAPRPEPYVRPEPYSPPYYANPSFPCSGDLSWEQRAICSDESLAAQDRELAQLRQRVLAYADGQEVRRINDRWTEEWDRCGGSGSIPGCLSWVYREWISALRSLGPIETPQAAGQEAVVPQPDSNQPIRERLDQRPNSGSSGGQIDPRAESRNLITCILSDGQEARLSREDCREQSGVIYQ
jgi:serine/threonine protein kinase